MIARIVIGVDPGAEGGWAALDCASNTCLAAKPLPRAGKEPDGAAFADALRPLLGFHLLAVVEKVHAQPGNGARSMFSFGTSYGNVLGVLSGLGVPTELVLPPRWKAEILDGTERDKAAAIAWCRRVYPGVSLVQPGCRTPHNGVADALCIATYGARCRITSTKDAA